MAPKAHVEISSAPRDPTPPFPSKFTPKPSGSLSSKPLGLDSTPAPAPWAAPQQRKEPLASVPPPSSLPSQPTAKFIPPSVASSPGSKPGATVPMAPSNSTRYPTSLQTQFTAPSPSGPLSRPAPPNFTHAQQWERPQVQEKPAPTEQSAAAKDMVRVGVVSLGRYGITEGLSWRMRREGLSQAQGCSSSSCSLGTFCYVIEKQR